MHSWIFSFGWISMTRRFGCVTAPRPSKIECAPAVEIDARRADGDARWSDGDEAGPHLQCQASAGFEHRVGQGCDIHAAAGLKHMVAAAFALKVLAHGQAGDAVDFFHGIGAHAAMAAAADARQARSLDMGVGAAADKGAPVVLDHQVHLPLRVYKELFAILAVFEADLVEPFSGCRAAFDGRYAPVGGQGVGRQVLPVVEPAGDHGPVRVALFKAHDHLLACTRQMHGAPAGAGPVLGDAHPGAGRLAPLPVEAHLDPAVAVGVDLPVGRTGHDGGLHPPDHGPGQGLGPDDHLCRNGRKGVDIDRAPVRVHLLYHLGLLAEIDALGYGGWIGFEYRCPEGTSAGLAWAAPYGIRAG